MGVFLGYATVGGPAGMGDAGGARQPVFGQCRFQLGDPADPPRSCEPFGLVDHGHARRVVATVLKPFQSLQQYRHYVVVGHRAYYATHSIVPLLLWCYQV